MSNPVNAKAGLSVKDLVTTGIFTALLFVFIMVGGVFFATNPMLTFFMPAGSALLAGPVYLLMIAKVHKRWSITIMGVIMAIIWFVTGMHWAFALGYLIMAVVADFVAGTKQYKSKKINSLSYILFSLGGTGSYLVFFADPQGWAQTMLGNGTEQSYIDTMQATANAGIFIAMFAALLVTASISAFVGCKMLKKLLIAVLGVLCGKWKYSIKGVCFYAVVCVLTVWIMAAMTGTLRTMFVAFLGLYHKVYACGMLAGIVLSTTKVSEFLSAMNRIHAPKKFVITFAVMLRYIPTIQEDWHFVKDAMRMRDVSPSLGGFLSHPGMTVECIYVPLMMMASKAADELSIASVTRGIENPNPRTCLVQIKCGIADWMAMLIAVAFFIFELCMRGGVTG